MLRSTLRESLPKADHPFFYEPGTTPNGPKRRGGGHSAGPYLLTRQREFVDVGGVWFPSPLHTVATSPRGRVRD